MRDRCPYCGLPRISREYVDRWTRDIARDIKDHNCPAWEPKPALSIVDTDTAFIRHERNSPDGLKAWRESLR
jgi:hypothetical protein